MIHSNEWELKEEIREVVPHDSFSPTSYSVFSLYKKFPSFTNIDDENEPPSRSLQQREKNHSTFQTKHIPSEYLTTKKNYFYEAAFMLRLINQPQE